MDSKVSVIVPVYNVENYLNECIDSIISQTYRNIEIILVDDGSTDSSLDICNKYKGEDDRIIVLHKENGGLSSARNSGLDIMSGEYVCFIDSDDFIAKDYIELLLNINIRNNTKISACVYTRFSNINKIKEDNSIVIEDTIESKRFLENTYYQINQGLFSVSACNKLYHKSIFENIRFSLNKLYEDFEIIDKILLSTNYISTISKVLYYYRYTLNSITNSGFNKKKLTMLEYCDDWLKKYENDDELYNSLISMKFSRSLEIYYDIRNLNEYKILKKELWNFVLDNRKRIIKNKKNRKKVIYSAYCTMFGSTIYVIIYKLYKKFGEKFFVDKM